MKMEYPEDWLLPLEIYELVSKHDSHLSEEVSIHLNNIKDLKPKVEKLINDGLELIENQNNNKDFYL